MIYYTSDLHFGHKNIIEYEDRPWETIEDMTIGLIVNWNRIVEPTDETYILGDFAFQNSYMTPFLITDVLSRLNGKKHLIVGNHDTWINKQAFNPRYFESIDYYKEIKDQGKDIVLCHYPIENWNGMEHGSIHLHGHLHSNPTELYRKNRFNVGIDNWNYTPVTLKEVLDASKDR